MSEHDQDELRAVAHALADAARVETLRYFRSDALISDTKSDADFDPVTAGDRGAEKAMRAILEHRRPQDAILGEEFDAKPGESGLTWVLDPIDGTRGFVSGTPTWGVLISICDASGPIYGMIDQPYIGERFEGGFGRAEVTGPLGSRSLRARGAGPLSEATLFTTFPEVGRTRDKAGFDAVQPHVKLVRYGMDCYAYALLAAGQIDLVIEAGLQSYDICAPIGVVQAAGGLLTDWRGRPAHEGGQAIAASSPEIHAAALALLEPFADD